MIHYPIKLDGYYEHMLQKSARTDCVSPGCHFPQSMIHENFVLLFLTNCSKTAKQIVICSNNAWMGGHYFLINSCCIIAKSANRNLRFRALLLPIRVTDMQQFFQAEV
jgi:hypothetical protein